MKNTMKPKRAAWMLLLLSLMAASLHAQNAGPALIVQGTVTSSTDGAEVIGASIREIDPNNRVVSAAATDVNGHFVLKVKDMNNSLTVSYTGFSSQTRKMNGQKVLNFSLKENTMITEVVIKATKKRSEGGYSVPQREIGSAMQTLDAKEFEGLQVSSVDEALQGRIAGLDIVANSGDPGSGSSMRIRGVTSITGSSEPLIVLNGIPYTAEVDKNFDYANSNQEQYANMLSINPDDILDITVLKDAAASAIWGSKGANGVLMITTKKGAAGKVKLDYSYRKTYTKQPKGMNMLSGGDFTMLMKQAYLNPQLNDAATDVDEYNYDKNFVDYQNFNNNTDWVSEVTQVGGIDDQYLTISGGGERALYRVSMGLFNQNGTIIGQNLTRLSSRAYLEYAVSDRIKFIAEFALTNSDNFRSYTDNNNKQSLLAIAYKKMPNVGVYSQDSLGNNSNIYYNIPMSSMLDPDQRDLKNPVALAYLATNELKSFRILPTLRLNYDLLDPKVATLRYSMYVSFDINNSVTKTFLPQEVSNLYWSNSSVNRSSLSDNESLNIYSEQNLAWVPRFENEDHSFQLYGSLQIQTGSSSGQGITSYSLPSGEAIDPSAFAYLEGAGSGHSRWRSLGMMARAHYSYKSRYSVDGSIRRDGTTKFGPGRKYGDFPGINFRWNISDEPFMADTKSWLSMFSFRPSWGKSGNEPGSEGLQYSRYVPYGSYLGTPAMKPANLRLDGLKWETTEMFNYGSDIGLFDDKYTIDLNFYHKHTSDLLFPGVSVSSVSGFSSVPWFNGGVMDNDGWELNLYANQFIKSGKFSVDFRFNLSNYKNTLIQLDQKLLDSYNGSFNYLNGSYLTRVQENNSFGSIYGFRYKGVYQFDDYTEGMTGTSPFAKDEFGNVVTDQAGNPKPMWFNYYGKAAATPYKFRGGDAIYEDVNHDGSIDELDIVYLGNSNPKVNGGFGPTFRYKSFTCNMFFNFRYGNKIINAARMNAENMFYDNNQSIAVNWRWRKDGDVTNMPRALHKWGYNWLGSDRYVEDGSFLRFKYLQFAYSFPPALLKPIGIKKANAYINFNNVAVWSKYTGVDPEVGYGSLGVSSDNNSTPRSKDVTLGISIGL
jgi:TonB-linked SusC/RagA family outer membrane protein